MVKVFYKVLFTTTLSLVFISPSFSMDAPDDVVKLDKFPEENPVKYCVKNPSELYVLGRYYFTYRNTDYPVEVVKEYYRRLIHLQNDPAFAGYTAAKIDALYTYAILHSNTLNAQSSDADNDLTEQLMRRAAHAGSTKAEQFLETMGYNLGQ